MKYLSGEHQKNHEKLKAEFSQFNSNDKEAITLLYIVSAVPELEEIAKKSRDEDGYFQVRLFEHQAQDLGGADQALASLAVAIFSKDSLPLSMFATLNDEQLRIALKAKEYCYQDAASIYDIKNPDMLLYDN